jgi:beta-barrel assembly-enhancing protease
MPIKNKIITIFTITAFLFSAGLVGAPSGHCITIQQERELSKKFMAMVRSRYTLIKDPIIVDYVNRVGDRLVSVLPPQPFKYHFYVLKEDVYNAFASPAGNIFINSGLLAALDSEGELAGILGHEIGHVVCRHISQKIESSKKIGMATLAGMVAGVLLGIGGAGTAANALSVGSVAAGQAASLAYSREDEMQADQHGMMYVREAGYSGKGMLKAMEIIRSKQWYGSAQVPTYMMTHPALEDRISYIDNWLHENPSKPSRRRPPVGGFKLAHTRLVALYTDEDIALAHFKAAVAATPDDAMANYGYALALTRVDKWHEAAKHMQRAIEGNAMATSMLQDLGEIYFNEGRYNKALETLASSISDKYPEGKLYLGRTQMALGRYADARDTFRNLVRTNENYTQAYYYLGESSGRLGDMFAAHYNLGRFYQQKGDLENAGFHLNRALKLATNDSQKQMVEHQLKALKSKKKKKRTTG